MTDIVKIPFHDGEILSTLVDGTPYVVLRPAIERLGMDYSTQLKKLRRKSWAVVGQSPMSGADGKTYQMVTVDARTFLMLLATIDEHRVAESARPLLVAYQSEVADVLESYWSDGGVVNPRATDDQLVALETEARRTRLRMEEAEGQLRVLGVGTSVGLLSADWSTAMAEHVVARVLGVEPPLNPDTKPITVSEYLEDMGISGADLRSMSPEFGKRLKAAYRAEYLESPAKGSRFIDGATRLVSVYSGKHRPLFDQVWNDFYAGTSH